MVTRTLSELSERDTTRVGLDLVPAARRTIGLLRTVNDSLWLHDRPAIVEAVRRYEELWMPLMCGITVGPNAPVVLPPIDVEWVWFCHSLNPEGYQQYCESRFSKLIGKPAIFDKENEEYALIRCRAIWSQRYPSEPFENEADLDVPSPSVVNESLLDEVMKHRFLYSKFSEPYMTETMYLIAAKQRYKGFLYILGKLSGWSSRFVPTSDILIMWFTHQVHAFATLTVIRELHVVFMDDYCLSYPTVYAEDLKEIECDMGKLGRVWETVKQEEVEATKKLWQRTFDQPYEKAGGHIALKQEGVPSSVKPPIYWEAFDADVNTKYKSMIPRFLLEVCIFSRLNSRTRSMQDARHEFLRLRVVRCHRELKFDTPIESISHNLWRKACHLYCEFGTRGIVLELRSRAGLCLKGSKLVDTVTFYWNDLLRAPTLTLGKEVEQKVGIVASITPPAQAPYMLKCVPDRVTDDSGAMISDVILRMNHYRPQEGRWLSRTVLDHAGRESFVIRIRVGGGFWRRGGETPSNIQWEDRIIEVREGSWSYVAGSIGRAPEKVVGTAIPKEPEEEHWNAMWHFSTGDELMLRCNHRPRLQALLFVKLLGGRRMQFRTNEIDSNRSQLDEDVESEGEWDEDFVTLVRYTEENPSGKATALINWKLMIVEFIPEEDAVLILLLCVSILRSVSEMRKEDVGNLLFRRRVKEAKLGDRDWGSVILHPSSYSSSCSSFLRPWHWDAGAVMANDGTQSLTRQPAGFNSSAVEGGDVLYKRGIMS
ncbi:hypothetical protein CDL15_Pgr018344 [Punica granatum]|uniref:GRPD C-terminal domain-containing protein n=1 Tax=Punica granatum TaxID=22663 RepID=A0A218WJ31_PUNGR|nr:hypothetical protein CDL15_Pgr018344 [Punica granatum]